MWNFIKSIFWNTKEEAKILKDNRLIDNQNDLLEQQNEHIDVLQNKIKELKEQVRLYVWAKNQDHIPLLVAVQKDLQELNQVYKKPQWDKSKSIKKISKQAITLIDKYFYDEKASESKPLKTKSWKTKKTKK